MIISLDINDPDGGLDGYIGCEIPKNHRWLPSGRSGWQFKAVKRLTLSDAEEVVLNTAKTEINRRIKKLLENKEVYVLVIGGKDFNPEQIEEREKIIRETCRTKGFLDCRVRIYSSGSIVEWINSSSLSCIAHLKPTRVNFKDTIEWFKTSRALREPSVFIPDLKRENTIHAIRKAIISNFNGECATIIRLVGLSGIGKTRLVYEALNIKKLRDLVLYTESPDKLPLSRFNEIAQNENSAAIFVIDECPHHESVTLAKEAEGIGGRMTLITLDYDIDKTRGPKDLHIILKGLDNKALNELTQKTVPGLPDFARRKIIEFSGGYPRLAVLLSENFSSDPDILSAENLTRLGIVSLFNRIIAGRHKDSHLIERTKKVLTAISLFKRIGWDDEVSVQGRKVCDLLNLNWQEARTIVNEQEERGLIIKRGRYRYTTPLPLATYLSSEWWKSMDELSWRDFCEKLPDLETKEAFFERLGDLSSSENAKSALQKILSEFSYELLNSETGSAIFFNLTKADHLLAIETLERILGSASKETLLEFKIGRRYIIGALERIAWWSDTFHRTARLLMKLADAENEPWSNNATGIFAQLFQTYLVRTTVPAWSRHEILAEALKSDEKSLQKLALKGLDSTFNLSHVTIMVREEQGIITPPPEWNPKTREDLEKSILSALRILDLAMEMTDPEIKIDATKMFLSHVRTLLTYGFKKEVIDRLQRIKITELSKELILTLEQVIFYDRKRLPSEYINELTRFRDELIGKDYSGLIKRYVKTQLLEDELDENRAKTEKIIRELAEQSINSHELLIQELSWLVTSEAENSHKFGKILGALDEEYYWLDLIIKATKDSNNPSVQFLGGYLSSIKLKDESLWENILERCFDDEILKKFLLEIIWRSGVSDKAVYLIIKMLKSKEIRSDEIRLLTYGAWFREVSVEVFMEFIEEFYRIEEGIYASVILGIIDQYANSHSQIVTEAKDLILKYTTRQEILENPDDNMIPYYWDRLSNKLMNEFRDTISHFVDYILIFLSRSNSEKMSRSGIFLKPFFQEKFGYALKNDFKNTWEKFKKTLLGRNFAAWKLIDILKGDYASFGLAKNSLLKFISETYLWEWIEENPDDAPYILAQMIPLHESEPILHPLARKLLIKYPADEDIASLIYANWHSEGFSGPESLHFENKLQIAEKWAEDPEPLVVSWVKKEVEYLKERIKIAKIREEERGF